MSSASTSAHDLQRSAEPAHTSFTTSQVEEEVQLAQTPTTSPDPAFSQPTTPAPVEPAPTDQSPTLQTPIEQTPAPAEQAPLEQTPAPSSTGQTLDIRRAPTSPNYIGVGGSLGLIEDAYGDFGAFSAISKFRITSIFRGADVSVRPSIIVGSDVTILAPFTIDLVGISPDLPATVIPYVGPGVTFTTDDDAFYFTLTGGLDFPIGQFTANAALNIGFLDDVALGFQLGIGYNF
ncbi:hypothetical protein [Leptolyngbya sp. FACHB-261]|uniref:hypothetical protein n=1 Tax=Leptolyngbya sp. FACHB-261 TaxID=2692806 RepID=UPI0016863E4D|nr:hypothetical protein [Leptolyngbya sp. FACHB-261]MBD2099667.1 hypothetical protein [Leptolyngbya sp. FACHB-261]